MTVATKLDVHVPEEAPARPTSWTDALMAWRAAERQLASIPAGSPEGDALRAEIEAQRLLYKELSGQFAAQATPVARTTRAALVPVMEAAPVALTTPAGEAAQVAEATPVAVPKPAPRAKAVTRAKSAVRLKPLPESARAS